MNKLVPVEPTEEMIKNAQWEDGRETAINVYRLMLEASPPVEAEPVGWKLVPIKPIKEMLHALAGIGTEHPHAAHSIHMLKRYEAMLEVSPTPTDGNLYTSPPDTEAKLKKLESALHKINTLRSSTKNYAMARVIACEALGIEHTPSHEPPSVDQYTLETMREQNARVIADHNQIQQLQAKLKRAVDALNNINSHECVCDSWESCRNSYPQKVSGDALKDIGEIK